MLRTVVLQHHLPDGSSHYDWMLELPPQPGEFSNDPDARRLLTFRTPIPPFPPPPAPFHAEKLPNHRVLYLTYEGDLTDNRGRVASLATGTYTPVNLTENSLELVIHIPESVAPLACVARRDCDNFWIFSLRSGVNPGKMDPEPS